MLEFLILGLLLALAALGYYAYGLRENNRRQAQALAELRRRVYASEEAQAVKIRQLTTLANSAYDALIVLNAAYRIVAINRSAEKLFNCTAALGQDLVETTNMPELELIVRGALTNDEEDFEEQLRIGQNTYRVRTEVFRCEEQILIGMTLQDISQLVRLNRARRDMVANISHELRTPIANIRLIIDGLFHEQDKPKRKDSISSLRAIAQETDALLWLVQEMADLSMIESGQAIVRMYDVPLAELVEEAVERIADQSQAKGLSIVREVPAHIHVLCDRDLTKRVLINLLHNAVKWSPANERITITAVNGAEEVTVSVLDQGPGVPPEQCERIFERFYQVDASRSGHEGTGLGLAICKHIVEAHGGRIWAESNQDGGGGRFRFTLLSADEHSPQPDRFALEGQ